MNFLFPLIAGIGTAIGGSIFGSRASAADTAAAQQAEIQKQIVNYLLNRRQNVYDPLLDQVVIPAMVRRLQAGPSWAPLAQANIQRLTTPFALNY